MFLNEISPAILLHVSKNILPFFFSGVILLMPIINLELKKNNPSNNLFCGLPLISWVLLCFHERENYGSCFSCIFAGTEPVASYKTEIIKLGRDPEKGQLCTRRTRNSAGDEVSRTVSNGPKEDVFLTSDHYFPFL